MSVTKALTSLFSLECGACKTCSIVAQWNLVWNPPKNWAEVVFMDAWSLFRHSVTWKSSMKYWQMILMHLSWFLDTTVVLMMYFFMFSSESVWRYLVYNLFVCLTYVNFVCFRTTEEPVRRCLGQQLGFIRCSPSLYLWPLTSDSNNYVLKN